MKIAQISTFTAANIIRRRPRKATVLILLATLVLAATADAALDFAKTLRVRSELQSMLDATVLLSASDPEEVQSTFGSLFTALSASLVEFSPTAQFRVEGRGIFIGTATVFVRSSLFTYMMFGQPQETLQTAATASGPDPSGPSLLGFFSGGRLRITVEAVARSSASGPQLVR